MPYLFCHIETFDHIDYEGGGAGETFVGASVQPRVDVELDDTVYAQTTRVRKFKATPDLVVQKGTRYLNVVTTGTPTLVYAGPASVSDADKQARAVILQYDNTHRRIGVSAGDVVHVFTLYAGSQ